MILLRKIGILLFTTLLFSSCEKLIEIEPPKSRISKSTVFLNEGTAIGALNGLYYSLHDYSNGYTNSIGVLIGLSSDELIYQMIDNTTASLHSEEINSNNITHTNSLVNNLWSKLYYTIYSTNSFLESIKNSEVNLSESARKSLEGQALFIRSFAYFYLINIFGDVPLILTTDYRKNALIPKTSKEEIYNLLLKDLEKAESLLEESYVGKERTRVNKMVVQAFLSRVNLYTGNWAKAEEWSSKVIEKNNFFQIEQDLRKVFLKDSKEVIWQITRIGTTENAYEAFLFLQNSWHILSLNFLQNLFSQSDLRANNWLYVKDQSKNIVVPYKYRATTSTGTSEHSVVIRLAEIYLIRSEAKLKQGDFIGAIDDLNVIITRAGNTPIDQSEIPFDLNNIMNLILRERQKELFAEWGHRWFDLKRLDIAIDILSNVKPHLRPEDLWFPIPESEKIKNPNL